MTAPGETPEFATAAFEIGWRGRKIEAEAAIPTGTVRPRVLLPLVQQLATAIVGLAEAAVRDRGKEVTCRAGCGACCRQLVPVTATEAHHLRDLIDAMPEPRRSVVRERFAAGREHLDEAGFTDAVRGAADAPNRLALGRAYFLLGIACPFLEDESCSIHPDRPLACREYLVTSPAENCRASSDEGIRKVLLPARPMPAFASLDGPTPAGGVRWVALLLAPEWADANPEPPANEPGIDLFARFMASLTRDHSAPPDGPA